MKVDYRKILAGVTDSLRHYQQIEPLTEETGGIDFFPRNEAEITGETTSYRLRFNPKVLPLLALYNLVMSHGCDTAEAIIRYILFHAGLETDNYTLAAAHLGAFRKETARFRLSGETCEEAGAQLMVQLYFLLYHEAFHIIFHRYPDQRDTAFGTTRSLLLDIKAEWEDGISLVSDEELSRHPKYRQHTEGLIPKELPASERQAIEKELHRQMAANRLRPEYIDEVLAGNSMPVEEITCDRQAWLNLLALFENNGITARDILQLHLSIFPVFNAMDFNKVLQAMFVPSYHERSHYDGMRVVLRHKAFKALLRQYSPEAYRLLKSEYLDLNTGLEAVFRSSVMALYRHTDDLKRLYDDRPENPYPDFARIRELEKAMSVATGKLV